MTHRGIFIAPKVEDVYQPFEIDDNSARYSNPFPQKDVSSMPENHITWLVTTWFYWNNRYLKMIIYQVCL